MTNDKKIISVNLLPLSFPVSYCLNERKVETKTYHLLVFVKTEGGIIGVGEGTPYFNTLYNDYKKALLLANLVRNYTLGDAVNLIQQLEISEIKNNYSVRYGAYLALESAIIDAFAKSHAKHIAEVIGGFYKKQIPVVGTIFLKHPKIMSKELERYAKMDVKHIKFKIPLSFDELRIILGCLKEKREAMGIDIVLRADANGVFQTLCKATRALQLLVKYGIDIVEQPMPPDKLREIAKLRKAFHPTIKILLDESLRVPSDIQVFAELEATDAINFHPPKLGCLTITRKAILDAKKLGFEVQIGSASMTEVGLTHYLNLAASIPNLDYPLEEIGLLNFSGLAVSSDPYNFMIQNGALTVPVNSPSLHWRIIRAFTFCPKNILSGITKYLRYLHKSI